MNNESKHHKELILLSAYLDNELPISKRQSLEKRLLNEPDLRRKLDDLRKTKMVLGNLARVQAPRNFTLTPDMVKVRQKRQIPWFSTLKLATSLAAILLVALFSFELIIQRGFLGGTQTAMDTGTQTESLKTLDDETPQPLIFWSEPGTGGGGVGASDDLPEESEKITAPQIDPERSPEEPDIKEEPVEEELLEESPPADSDLPPAEEAPAEPDRDLILGLNPEAGGEIINQSEPATSASRTSSIILDVFDWLQIALALFVFFGGVTLWILRSRQIF